MTPHRADIDSGAADGADLPDAGAPEIDVVVTPAMELAGEARLRELRDGPVTLSYVVSEVYSAMVRVRE